MHLAGNERARRSEREETADARRAKRFRRRQEVDRFEQVGLPLTVAADDDVDVLVKRHLVGSKVPERLGRD